jgi:hypothetical protein
VPTRFFRASAIVLGKKRVGMTSNFMSVSGMLPNTCCEGNEFFAEKQANSLLHLARLKKPERLVKRGTNYSLTKKLAHITKVIHSFPLFNEPYAMVVCGVLIADWLPAIYTIMCLIIIYLYPFFRFVIN